MFLSFNSREIHERYTVASCAVRIPPRRRTLTRLEHIIAASTLEMMRDARMSEAEAIEESLAYAMNADGVAARDAVVRQFIATQHPHLCESNILGNHHCLFNSVIDQIRSRKIESTLPMNQVGLRHAVAVAMRALVDKHPGDMALRTEFITRKRADEIDSRDANKKANSNTTWGGDAELFMICHMLQRPVYLATMRLDDDDVARPVLFPVHDRVIARFPDHIIRESGTKAIYIIHVCGTHYNSLQLRAVAPSPTPHSAAGEQQRQSPAIMTVRIKAHSMRAHAL